MYLPGGPNSTSTKCSLRPRRLAMEALKPAASTEENLRNPVPSPNLHRTEASNEKASEGQTTHLLHRHQLTRVDTDAGVDLPVLPFTCRREQTCSSGTEQASKVIAMHTSLSQCWSCVTYVRLCLLKPTTAKPKIRLNVPEQLQPQAISALSHL